MVRLFEDHCKRGFLTMKFHVLDHLCDNLKKFPSIQFLDASPYEHYKVLLERAYCRTSMRRATRIRKTASALKAALDGMKMKERDPVRIDRSLVRQGDCKRWKNCAISFQEPFYI